MSEPDFRALFSRQAGAYAQFRPTYPPAWFDFLAGETVQHEAALDCATGSGQAVSGLGQRFRRVFAADPGLSQLAHRSAHPRAVYLAARAEQLPFGPACFDLVTAAQAAHWFDMDRFNAEARRVLRPGGIVAVWCYEMLHINPEIDAVVDRLYEEITGAYWSPRRSLIEAHYATLPFAFDEISPPEVSIETHWTLENLTGYLNSWSATQEFIRERGYNPLSLVQTELLAAWGNPAEARTAIWPVYARVGRV